MLHPTPNHDLQAASFHPQTFLSETPSSDCVPKDRYFPSLHSSTQLSPQYRVGRMKKCQAWGTGPQGGEPHGRDQRVVAGGTQCSWRRKEICVESPRSSESPPRKLNLNLAVGCHGGACWKRDGRECCQPQQRPLVQAGQEDLMWPGFPDFNFYDLV